MKTKKPESQNPSVVSIYPLPEEGSKQKCQGSPVDPVELTAAAVSYLIQTLPSGTSFCIGVVLIVMMTGRLVQNKGSLARAALPFVVSLRWGWHRVHRAMERGKFALDTLFDRTLDWCLDTLPVEPVRLGAEQREGVSIDTSTIARLRSGARLALAGKGFCQRAGRKITANIVAVATRVVLIRGVRVGLVRRVRFASSSQEAEANLFADLPKTDTKRLIVVDAGIATKDRFAAATPDDALLGRVRINSKLRCAPPPPMGKRGHPVWHGAVLHPGAKAPEVEPDEDFTKPSAHGEIRIRRWNTLHDEDTRQMVIDVVRVDDPVYHQPLVVGSTARELTASEMIEGSHHRWPVETNCSVGQDTTAMEMPRAWTEQAFTRRIG